MKNSLANHARFENHLVNLASERREFTRSDCAFEAVTQFDGGPKDTVYVTNLSTNGLLMIVTPGTFVPEEFQLLGLSELPKNCRKIWQRSENVGVEFIDQLTDTGIKSVSRLGKA